MNLDKILGGMAGFLIGLLCVPLAIPFTYYGFARKLILEDKEPVVKAIAWTIFPGSIGVLFGSPLIQTYALTLPFRGMWLGMTEGFFASLLFPLKVHATNKNFIYEKSSCSRLC